MKNEKDCILKIVCMTAFPKVGFLKAEKNVIQINLVKERIQIHFVKDTLKIKSKDSKFKSLYNSSGQHTHNGTHIILGRQAIFQQSKIQKNK